MMRTSKNVIFLGLVLCLFLTGQIFATDRFVNGQAGASGLGLYETVQAAIDDAFAFDTIYIYDDANTPPVPGAVAGLASYDGTAVVDVDNLAFIGIGTGVSIDDETAGTQTAFTISSRDGLSFTNMAVNGYMYGFNGPAVTNLAMSDISMDGNDVAIRLNVNDGVFDNVAMFNGGTYGMYIYANATYTAADNNLIMDCDAYDNTGKGMYFLNS